ncbi:Os01g0966500, partial [Oryza sativa Japonica Group]
SARDSQRRSERKGRRRRCSSRVWRKFPPQRPPLARGDGDDRRRLAGLAFMFSTSILLQILACALYNNWWPMLAALMYVLVPMPCLFFGGGSTQFLTSRDGGGWFNAAKFLTGASAMGSIAIPAILRHAGLIETGAMFIEFTSFFILVCTVMCFHRATLDEDW